MADSCFCGIEFRSPDVGTLRAIHEIFEGCTQVSADGRALPAKALAVACWGEGSSGSKTGTSWIRVIDSGLDESEKKYWISFESANTPPEDGLRALHEDVFEKNFDFYCTYFRPQLG